MITGAVALVIAIPLMVVLYLVGWPWFLGLLLGLVAAVALIWPKTKHPADVVLASFRGRRPGETRDARLINLVEGLSLSTGVTEPTVVILEEPAGNAMTVSDDDGVTIVLTQGLLDSLDRMQLEGVVAELLIRAKDGDADLATAVASLVSGLSSGLLRPFAPFVSSRAVALFDEDRDLLADQAAVGVTRYPPALASAFAALKKSGSTQPSGVAAAYGHLWLIPPPNALVPSHPLDLRIDVLEEI